MVQAKQQSLASKIFWQFFIFIISLGIVAGFVIGNLYSGVFDINVSCQKSGNYTANCLIKEIRGFGLAQNTTSVNNAIGSGYKINKRYTGKKHRNYYKESYLVLSTKDKDFYVTSFNSKRQIWRADFIKKFRVYLLSQENNFIFTYKTIEWMGYIAIIAAIAACFGYIKYFFEMLILKKHL